MKLIEKYAAKPPEELPLLFQRILQNTIRDFYRRQKTRSLWTILFSSLTPINRKAKMKITIPWKLCRLKEHQILIIPHKQLEQSQLIKSDRESYRSPSSTSTRGLPVALLGGNGRDRNRTGDGML